MHFIARSYNRWADGIDRPGIVSFPSSVLSTIHSLVFRFSLFGLGKYRESSDHSIRITTERRKFPLSFSVRDPLAALVVGREPNRSLIRNWRNSMLFFKRVSTFACQFHSSGKFLTQQEQKQRVRSCSSPALNGLKN